MEILERHYALTGYADTPASAAVTLHRYGRGERMRRAAKGAGAAWAAALGSVFIPVAHFVLVPTFLVLGAFLGWSRARTRVEAVRVHGRCPDCGTEQDFDAHGSWQTPYPVACQACHRALTIREPGTQ